MAGSYKRDSKGRFSGSGSGKASKRVKSKFPVQDTILKQTSKGAAKASAKRGGNLLQQRAAANNVAQRSMRRSSATTARVRAMFG
jgi:hypothetical protein